MCWKKREKKEKIAFSKNAGNDVYNPNYTNHTQEMIVEPPPPDLFCLRKNYTGFYGEVDLT
jgi:hypothetical protein